VANQWHSKTAQEAMSELQVTSKGLTAQEAQERQKTQEPNESVFSKDVKVFLRTMPILMTALLLIAFFSPYALDKRIQAS
jgi:hypothetical protein